ncbi:hypothetical protein TSOC_003866 [Tetrabaena socialis]|uniref:Uncharacterized protein n=1 Tax=Tetrabaena socialis TaxID=47790 RepID=A0A2J8AAE8_9CHLO|nr:hypothetical protein TSOC_003866 [Tetrabaena socialis]|eukprot:PNH09500.1 hypothetical protein TSOC_003866 [Tetrabaena socialis]
MLGFSRVKQLRAAAGQVPVDSKQDAAAKGVINKISKERNQELERLTGELVGVRGELEALRLKYDGATSRRKILEPSQRRQGRSSPPPPVVPPAPLAVVAPPLLHGSSMMLSYDDARVPLQLEELELGELDDTWL